MESDDDSSTGGDGALVTTVFVAVSTLMQLAKDEQVEEDEEDEEDEEAEAANVVRRGSRIGKEENEMQKCDQYREVNIKLEF